MHFSKSSFWHMVSWKPEAAAAAAAAPARNRRGRSRRRILGQLGKLVRAIEVGICSCMYVCYGYGYGYGYIGSVQYCR